MAEYFWWNVYSFVKLTGKFILSVSAIATKKYFQNVIQLELKKKIEHSWIKPEINFIMSSYNVYVTFYYGVADSNADICILIEKRHEQPKGPGLAAPVY